MLVQSKERYLEIHCQGWNVINLWRYKLYYVEVVFGWVGYLGLIVTCGFLGSLLHLELWILDEAMSICAL